MPANNTPTVAEVRAACEHAHVTTFSSKGGTYTVRKGFFYTHGKTGTDLRHLVFAQLRGAGLEPTLVEEGEVWKPFRGGAPTAQSSHWFVKFTVVRAGQAPQA